MDTYWQRKPWTLIRLARLAADGCLLAARLYAAMMVLAWRDRTWAPHPERAAVLRLMGTQRADVAARREALEQLVQAGLLEPERGGYRITELEPPELVRRRHPEVVWQKPPPTLPEHWLAIASTRSPGRIATLVGALLRCAWRRADGSPSGVGRCRRRLVVELFGVCELTVSRAWRALSRAGLLRRIGDPTDAGPLFELAGLAGSVAGSAPQPAKSVAPKNEHLRIRSTNRKHAAPHASRARSERAPAQDALHVDAAELAAVPGWIAVWKRYVRAKAISPQLPLQVFGRTLLCAQRLGRSPGAMVRVAAQRGIWFGCARDEDRAQRMIATYKAARDREQPQPAGQAADLVTALAQKWAC